MRPSLGSRNLVKRLKQVGLPSPFGPMSPWIEPSATLRSTFLTATNPLTCLVRALVPITFAMRRSRRLDASKIRPGTRGSEAAARHRQPFSVDELAAAVREGEIGLRSRHRSEELVEIPFALALFRCLDLEEIHVMDHAPIGQNLAAL